MLQCWLSVLAILSSPRQSSMLFFTSVEDGIKKIFFKSNPVAFGLDFLYLFITDLHSCILPRYSLIAAPYFHWHSFWGIQTIPLCFVQIPDVLLYSTIYVTFSPEALSMNFCFDGERFPGKWS